MKFNKRQTQAALELLWEHLPKDRENKDRRQTGWGTKTKVGLIACLERVSTRGANLPPSTEDTS